MKNKVYITKKDLVKALDDYLADIISKVFITVVIIVIAGFIFYFGRTTGCMASSAYSLDHGQKYFSCSSEVFK